MLCQQIHFYPGLEKHRQVVRVQIIFYYFRIPEFLEIIEDWSSDRDIGEISSLYQLTALLRS